jgi:uncharacterized SAM-binding protein YcdF (DUF218 family)
MFAVVKFIEQLLFLPSFIVIGLLVVFWLWSKKQDLAKKLLMVLFALLFVFSIEPTAFFLEQSLYNQINAVDYPALETVDAIVILAGGATNAAGLVGNKSELGGASWRRFWEGIELYRETGEYIPIIYAGGSGDAFQEHSSEAWVAQDYANKIGVPNEHIWIEGSSRNTYESAVAVGEDLDFLFDEGPRTIFLVTSVTHMWRSVKTFEANGYVVIPHPSDYQEQTLQIDLMSFIPNSASLHQSNRALHEWVGIVWYSVSGKI